MRSIQIGMARALLCATAFLAIGCSTAMPAIPFTGARGPRQLNSFMGVDFGDTLEQVERRFPAGTPQTSPYGAPAYVLENVGAGSIDYQDVIYEFAEGAGMQLVIARFAPSETAAVFQQLQTTLGAPVTPATADSDPAKIDANWQLPDGDKVLFSGPLHRMALVGKKGGSLTEDIQLRDTEVPSAS